MIMSKDFSPGDRIRISEDYHWAKGELGSIMQPPDYVVNFADGWVGIHREVSFSRGNADLLLDQIRPASNG